MAVAGALRDEMGAECDFSWRGGANRSGGFGIGVLKIEAHGGVHLRFGWQPVRLVGLLVANYSASGVPKGFGLCLTRVCHAIGEARAAFCCRRPNDYQGVVLGRTRHLARVAGGCQKVRRVRCGVGCARTAKRRSVGGETTVKPHGKRPTTRGQKRCAPPRLVRRGSRRTARLQRSIAPTSAPHGTALAAYGGHAARPHLARNSPSGDPSWPPSRSPTFTRSATWTARPCR